MTSWKEQSAKLHRWLRSTPDKNHGAKAVLQTRFGIRPAVPFVSVLAFGLPIDEPPDNGGPDSDGAGAADPRGRD